MSEEKQSPVQKRVLTVMERISLSVKQDPEVGEVYAQELDELLSKLNEEGFFGSEGQCDPRGDFRNGAWSMACVEGVTG